MAEQSQEDPPRSSHEFVESSILDTIVPHATHFDIEEALNGSVERLDDAKGSPVSSIAQRNFIFFDEELDVYIVLQTPYSDERTLRSYLGRLVVTLEAQAQNSPPNNDGSSMSETVYSQSIQDIQDPIIVVQEPDKNDESSKDGHILLVWKVPAVRVNRPRMRIGASTAVMFSASAFLKPADQVQSDTQKDEYLPSLIPSGINLLESFGQDSTMLANNRPRLSALRVSRVIPATNMGRDLMRHFKNLSRRSFKAFPAFGTRIKYSRPNITPNSQVMIASLDIDIIPVSGCDVIVNEIAFKMPGGTVENLNKVKGLNMPVNCLPLDNITFLYRLSPNEQIGDLGIKTHIRALEILIKATAVVSEDCKPPISMNWKTSIDFTIPVNPGYGQPSQTLQRNRRPANLSIDSFDTVNTIGALRPDFPSAESAHQRSSTIPDFGITITFTGPEYCTPSEIFTWNAFVVNRSMKPRKLALIVIPKRKRGEPRLNRPPSMGRGSDSIADAIIDENIVHVMQKNAAMDGVGIICLSADLRVGPLPPAACHDVDIKMLTLVTGVIELEAVRVVDMGTNEHVDIHDLPTIVSVGKESKGAN